MHKYRGYSFEGFLTDVVLKEAEESEKPGYKKMFLDWRPYNTHCNFCKISFTVISKTETFNEDREKILEMVGEKGEDYNEQRHVHTGDQTQELTKQFFANISSSVKLKLLNLYKYDFELFGYDTNIY